MTTREQITFAPQIAAARAEKHKADHRRTLWLGGLALSGMFGIGCGVAGLLLSFLAAQGFTEPSSAVRLAVPILIVLSLSLLMFSAHCMDRLHRLRIEK